MSIIVDVKKSVPKRAISGLLIKAKKKAKAVIPARTQTGENRPDRIPINKLPMKTIVNRNRILSFLLLKGLNVTIAILFP